MDGAGKNLRLAIVGAGRMGRERARAATSLGARVVTVCDPDFQRARHLAFELQAAASREPEQIAWGALDALFVCTPPGARGPAETLAIDAAVPIFVEKQVGVCAERSLPVLRGLQERRVVSAVGYMNRYRDSVLRARRLAARSATLGAAFQWLAAPYRVPWWLDREQSGGSLNEQGTHFIDLCRFLIGDVVEVRAAARPHHEGKHLDGAVVMTLRFANGALAAGLYSCEASEKQIAFEVFLPDRSVRLEGWDLRLKGDPPECGPAAREAIFVKEVAAFFQAIRSGDRALIQSDFEDAVQTQRVVDAIGRALRTGRPEPVVAQAALHN